MSYISNDGKRYNSYEDYCNSDDLDYDIKCVLLATWRRIPQNDNERELLDEINELKRKGKQIVFPFN